MRFLIALLALWLLPLPVGAQEPMLLPIHPERLVIDTATGEKSFSIEVADEPEKRRRGLMFRRSMRDDHGMLFVFEQSGQLGFWMQNTPMPLDLLFIGEDGRVRAIEQGEPFSTDSIAPPVMAQFVLELKAGTALRSGIAVGDPVRHPVISAAIGG
ncbi:DUF192 domain-containing protein [Chelativorans sp. SCAU2101]|uniref:DUF192 domain-containing protein n=1 Tax=Chelativorans petroleitrophicus TaxID=2975484 RepID=A0A9X2X939_9HYPH|nr:DUF192 domain-containing protein [Chelativorans petroleitrophicus]MCT8990744.1 DUF192 domain-containing protein [Chelativorans petroleitrophicus]